MRAVFAALYIVLGVWIIKGMAQYAPRAGFIVGVVLGAAMIALGVHRLALIWRARGSF
jgi:hypothetical protein